MIAREHKPADPFHVVDADRHRLAAGLDEGRQRGSLTRAGDFRADDRLIGLDRGENDALAAFEKSGDRRESAGRNGFVRPSDLAQHLLRDLRAEAQRHGCHHHGSGHQSLRLRVHVSAELGLPIEPRLRDKDGKQAEHDGNADHHCGTGTHGRHLGLMRLIESFSRTELRPSIEFFLKQSWRLETC